MKESVYRSYDALPLFLNSNTVSKVLGVSSSSTYELMHTEGFPTLRIQWVSTHTQGGGHQ